MTSTSPTREAYGSIVIGQLTVSNLMAEYFYNVSSNKRYDTRFSPIKKLKEINSLNVTTNDGLENENNTQQMTD